MAYILFKNFTPEEIDTIINYPETVSRNSGFGPDRDTAVGVCTTTINNKYTFLNEAMCTRENPYISWVMRRKEFFSVEEFIAAVNDHIREYNLLYKGLAEEFERGL